MSTAAFHASATTFSPGWFSTPGDLTLAAQQTDAVVTALDSGVAASKRVVKSVRDEWATFAAQWKQFFDSNLGPNASTTLHWLTSNLQGQLVNFQQQVATWASKLAKYGVRTTGATPAEAPGGSRSVFVWIGIGVVALAGLFILGKLVHTVVLGGSNALTAAEDEAMRISDRARAKRHSRSAYSIS